MRSISALLNPRLPPPGDGVAGFTRDPERILCPELGSRLREINCLPMAVVPTPGCPLRPADIHVPNADRSAVALESSSVGSRVSKFRIGTGLQKAPKSTTRATRGRELPKSTVGLLLPGPLAIVPSTVPFAQVRRCAPGRRRPESQSRPRNRLFPPCNPVEFSVTFRPLPGEPPRGEAGRVSAPV